jgi:hypothetical protein
LGTLWSRVRVARQGVEASLKPSAKVLDSGESVSFAARILNGGLITRRKIQPRQPEVSFRCIQHRIETPSPSKLIALQFSDEVREKSVAVVTGHAGSRSDGGVETIRIAGIPHCDGLCRLRICERANQ